ALALVRLNGVGALEINLQVAEERIGGDENVVSEIPRDEIRRQGVPVGAHAVQLLAFEAVHRKEVRIPVVKGASLRSCDAAGIEQASLADGAVNMRLAANRAQEERR